jgi:hypothetical protein
MRLVVFMAVKIYVVVLSVISTFRLVSGFLVSEEYATVSIFFVVGRGNILLHKFGTHSPDYTVM